ncbi:putative reverse transcriptase domain-containing protein [Tanacetum coccineum]
MTLMDLSAAYNSLSRTLCKTRRELEHEKIVLRRDPLACPSIIVDTCRLMLWDTMFCSFKLPLHAMGYEVMPLSRGPWMLCIPKIREQVRESVREMVLVAQVEILHQSLFYLAGSFNKQKPRNVREVRCISWTAAWHCIGAAKTFRWGLHRVDPKTESYSWSYTDLSVADALAIWILRRQNSGAGRDQRNRGQQSHRATNSGSQQKQGTARGYTYPVCTNVDVDTQESVVVLQSMPDKKPEHHDRRLCAASRTRLLMLQFASCFTMTSVPLDHVLCISTPMKDSARIPWYRDLPLQFNDRIRSVNALPLDMCEFDIILGMDWLSAHHATIDCYSRRVIFGNIHTPEFIYHGSLPGQSMKIISALEAPKLFPNYKTILPEELPGIPLPSRCGFQIYSDASKKGLGCVLMQHGKVIAYASRQLKPYEREFHKKSYRLHLLPSANVSEIDPRFADSFLKGFTERLGNQLKFSTSFHPETERHSELTIQTLETCYVSCALEWNRKLRDTTSVLVEKCLCSYCFDQVVSGFLRAQIMIEVTNEKGRCLPWKSLKKLRQLQEEFMPIRLSQIV